MLKRIERIGLEVEYGPANPLSASEPPPPEPNTRTHVLPKGSVHRQDACALTCDIVVDYDQPVAMRDGVILYADIYRPDTTEKVPAILVYTPYCKRGGWWNYHFNATNFGVDPASVSGLQAFEAPDPAFWVNEGYAIVVVDAAGTGYSGGDQPFMGTASAERAYDAIEFVAKLDWCTGDIAMSGNSQLGMIQWAAAALRPPHLKAIAPWEGLTDQYREVSMRGGISDQNFHDKAISPFIFGQSISENVSGNSKRYPLINAYWEDKRPNLSAIEIPAYVVASWTSPIHARGTLNGFRHIASKNKWLRVHNTQEWVDIADRDNVADLKKFFDHVLKGIDNGWEETPFIRLSVLNPGGEDIVGRPETEWPLAREERRILHLDSRTGCLSSEPVLEESFTEYESTDLQANARFVLEVAEDTEITGYINLHLFVEAAEADDLDLFAALYKEDANGKRLHHITLTDPAKRKWVKSLEVDGKLPATVSYTGPTGRLRVSHRALDPELSTANEPVLSHRKEEKVSPGEIVPVDLTLWPTSILVKAGERLVIEIAGHETGPLAPEHPPLPGSFLSLKTLNKGRHRIYTGGKHPSTIALPIVE